MIFKRKKRACQMEKKEKRRIFYSFSFSENRIFLGSNRLAVVLYLCLSNEKSPRYFKSGKAEGSHNHWHNSLILYHSAHILLFLSTYFVYSDFFFPSSKERNSRTRVLNERVKPILLKNVTTVRVTITN